MATEVITPLDGAAEIEQVDETIEPVFAIPEIRTIALPKEWSCRLADAFLAHNTTRNANDLMGQVQRILLAVGREDVDCAYGALVDLFLTLGTKGYALRRRMLDVVAPLLESEQHTVLSERLDMGLSALDRIPLALDSRLAKGVTGNCMLIERASEAAQVERDVLEDVHDYIEYGQMDEARQVLEEALLKDIGRLELHTELLQLYQATRERDGFASMMDLLSIMDNPFPDQWSQAAEQLL